MTPKHKNIFWLLALLFAVMSLAVAQAQGGAGGSGDEQQSDLPVTDRGGDQGVVPERQGDVGEVPPRRGDTGEVPPRRGDVGEVPGSGEFPIETEQDVIDVLNRLIDWMFTILLLVATIMIIYAGYLFFTAANKPENATKARSQLLYAAIAIGVGLVARGVEALVRQLLGR